MTDEREDKASLERRLTKLTTERTTLFAQAGATGGLSNAEQARLTSVEREIDECFIAVRRLRAAKDARRFTMEGPLHGRGITRRPPVT